MKTTILIVAAAAASAVSLHGQLPADLKLVADVPFTFHQNARVMPAGRYELKNGPTGTVVVANADTHLTAVSIVGSRIGSTSPKGFLRFECYGESNKCFLREIAAPGSTKSLTFGRGKFEKEYARYGMARVADIEVSRATLAAE
jgi:hypothetical protein